MRFHPPDEGLQPNENVIWTGRKGISPFIPFFGIFLGIGGLILIGYTVTFGIAYGLLALLLVLIGFFVLIRAYLMGRGTKYFLTNMRLLETRRDEIMKEFSLTRFKGKPINKFIEKKATYAKGDQPFYTVRFRDPISIDVLMEFKHLNEDAVESLLKRLRARLLSRN